MGKKISIKPKVFIIDVDGVMTTGQMIYTEKGKTMKIFGPDDHDGLSLLKKNLEIRFVTGDKIGLKISKKSEFFTNSGFIQTEEIFILFNLFYLPPLNLIFAPDK